MPGNPGFPVSGESIDLLVGEVNTQFTLLGGSDPQVDLSRVLFIDRPGSGSEGGLISRDGYYPLAALSWSDQAKGDTEQRDFGEAGILEIGPVRAKRYDGPSVLMPRRKSYDKYGLIHQAIPGMARWGMGLQLRLWSRMLEENPTSYDGLAMFHASHLVNKLDGATTYSNVLANTDLDEAGVAAAFQQLQQIPDLDGLSLANGAMSQPTIMVGSWNLYLKARHLFGFPVDSMAQIPTAAGTAAMTTVLGGGAKLIMNPFIVSLASDKVTAAKRWFVISEVGRPCAIYREEEVPQIVVTTDADYPRVSRDAHLAFSEAVVGMGCGEPRSILRVTTA